MFDSFARSVSLALCAQFSFRVIKLQLFIIGFVCKYLPKKKKILLSNANISFPSRCFNYFILNTLYWLFRSLFRANHDDNFYSIIISISLLFPFLPLLHFMYRTFCYKYFLSILIFGLSCSFYSQRTNINATTCKSTYEWRFSLHRYDLIESKYLNHFYLHSTTLYHLLLFVFMSHLKIF